MLINRVILLLPLFYILLTPHLQAEELTIITEEMPPYNYSDENKTAAGFSTEIVKELLRRTEIAIADGKIKVYPWARAYMIIEKNKNVLVYSMTRSEERENLFKWVGPIASRTIWFWKLKERNDIVVNSLQDAKKYKVGAVLEFSSANYMKSLGFDLDLCTSEERNFKKLIANRIDMLTALELSAAYHMKKQHRDLNDLEKLVRLDDRYDYYLALNINTSDEIVNKLQIALDNAKKDGTYQKIKELYLK